jgi:hypothetical protein
MKKLLASLALGLMLLVVAPVGVSQAWSIVPKGDCSGAAAGSAVCEGRNNNSNPLTGSNGLLLNIANIVALVAGAAAVVIIILAGLRYVQSSGNPEDIAGARRTLIYAIVGLVIIVLARALVGLALSAV